MYSMRHSFGMLVLLALFGAVSARAQGLVGNTYDPETAERRGQAGMTFLQMGGSTRGEALGGSFISVQNDLSTVFYNVAGVSTLKGYAVCLNHTDWLSDMTVDHFAFAMNAGRTTVGITYQSMDYGFIQGTLIDLDEAEGYRKIGSLEPEAWSFGTFIAVPLTDRFGFGVRVKYSMQDFGASGIWIATSGVEGYYTNTASDLRVSAMSIDIGSQYNTGFRNIMISMALQDFGRPKRFVESDFSLPLTYRIGAAADLVEIVTGASLPNQNIRVYADGVETRDITLDLAAGVEYSADLSSVQDGLAVALRIGRRAGNQLGWLSYGAGVVAPIGNTTISVDYAYGDYGASLTSHHWGIGLVMP